MIARESHVVTSSRTRRAHASPLSDERSLYGCCVCAWVVGMLVYVVCRSTGENLTIFGVSYGVVG